MWKIQANSGVPVGLWKHFWQGVGCGQPFCYPIQLGLHLCLAASGTKNIY